MINKLLKGKVFSFVFFRYIGYGIQFLNSILIAKNLGPFAFGIYAFSMLIFQYANYMNLGIPYSLNVALSRNLGGITYKDKSVLGASIISLFFISLFVIIFATLIKMSTIDILVKYSFYDYIWVITLLVILEQWCQLFINLYRTYAKLKLISLYQVLPQLLIFIYCLFLDENISIRGVFFSYVIGLVTSILFFFFYKPLKPVWRINFRMITNLISKGISLLIYNFVFNLILISTRTIISIFYSVEEMGIYSLVNSMSNAIGMLIGSVGFIFFPKMISKLDYKVSPENAYSFIKKANYWYFFTTAFVIYLVIGLIPIISFILPEYKTSIIPFSFLLLSQLILAYLFGYAVFLIARNKEKLLTLFALFAIVINTSIIYLFYMIGLPFGYVPLATMFSIFIYVLLARFHSLKLLRENEDRIKLSMAIKEMPLKKFLLPLLVISILNIFENGYMYYFIGFLFFISLSYREIKRGKDEIIFILRRNFL